MTVAGCGAGGPSGESSGTPTPAPTASPTSRTSVSTTSAATPSSTYLPSPEPELPTPAAAGKLERVTGRVGEGTERGCLLLRPENPSGSGRALQLLTDDARLVPGATVTIEGRRAAGAATTCQQGDPFTVTGVVSAS